MNFIKKIAEKKIDSLVHLQFTKFSKGIFKDRAIISAKKTGNKYTINTSAEFANELVRIMAQKIQNNQVEVSGAIITTADLTKKLDFLEMKQFQGVKRYIIKKNMDGNDLIKLLDEFPKAFFGLTFRVDENNILKIKDKAPKSGKPTKSDEEPKADFCKIITDDLAIGESFVFEKKDFKKAEIKHDYIIEKIILPKTEEKDFAKIREMAQREGKLIRYSNIDEIKKTTEYPFVA